jgi:L-ascorbate metabolism protein UlaG (beta-lactamase superfamily)
MQLQLIRHATQILTYAGRRFLIDPMLVFPGVFPSLTLGRSYARNPLAPLPCEPASLADVDAVLLTHTHFDHWDQAARKVLPKQLPVLCQYADAKKIKSQGFTSVHGIPIHEDYCDAGLTLRSFSGRHGQGVIGRLMGASSGFVLHAQGEPVLCISGDTVWCPEFERVLIETQPRVVVMYGGAAQFNVGAPITLDVDGLERIALAAPQAQLVAVHMDAINHCRISRRALSATVSAKFWKHRLWIPQDGERREFV